MLDPNVLVGSSANQGETRQAMLLRAKNAVAARSKIDFAAANARGLLSPASAARAAATGECFREALMSWSLLTGVLAQPLSPFLPEGALARFHDFDEFRRELARGAASEYVSSAPFP